MFMKKRNFLSVTSIALLVWALTNNPYWYYQMLRWIIAGSAGYLAYIFYEEEEKKWMWVMVIIAILFNPIFPIYLSREIWTPIDIIAAVLFLVIIVKSK